MHTRILVYVTLTAGYSSMRFFSQNKDADETTNTRIRVNTALRTYISYVVISVWLPRDPLESRVGRAQSNTITGQHEQGRVRRPVGAAGRRPPAARVAQNLRQTRRGAACHRISNARPRTHQGLSDCLRTARVHQPRKGAARQISSKLRCSHGPIRTGAHPSRPASPAACLRYAAHVSLFCH